MKSNVTTFRDYQAELHWLFPKGTDREKFDYALIGLFGEVGEFAEGVKKVLRADTHPINLGLSDPRRAELLLEAGDVLWYLTKLIVLMGDSLGSVARANLDKIEGRIEDGTFPPVAAHA